MSSLPLHLINTPARAHRRLLTETSPGHFDLCIDNTSREKMICPRAFEHYAVYGRDTGERDALNYGSALHKACEVFFKGGSLEDMQDAVVDRFRKFPNSAGAWRNLDHALEAVRLYYNTRQLLPPWNPITGPDGNLMVEVPFKIPLFQKEFGNQRVSYPPELVANRLPDIIPFDGPDFFTYKSISVYWTGKIDLVIERDDGLWVVDHKTTSIGGPTFWQSFKLASQMHGYVWATQNLLDRPVRGVIVDAIIGRAPTVKGKGVTHDNEQMPFEYSPEQLVEWERDTICHVSRIFDCLYDGYFPKETGWCSNKYGMCPYHEVCTMSKPMQPAILMSGMYSDKTWNPLEAF